MDLAAEWSVSSDLLRRHQVCELYASGYDKLAQEVRTLFILIKMKSFLLLLFAKFSCLCYFRRRVSR
jgi:hypothetical protein